MREDSAAGANVPFERERGRQLDEHGSEAVSQLRDVRRRTVSERAGARRESAAGRG